MTTPGGYSTGKVEWAPRHWGAPTRINPQP